MTDDHVAPVPTWLFSPAFRSPSDAPPPEGQVTLEFGVRTRPRPLRTASEDHYLVLRAGRLQETLMTNLPENQLAKRFEEYGYGMVVADGLGGDGETASRLAIATLMHLAIYFGPGHVRVDPPIADEMVERAARYYRSVDAALSQAGYSRQDVLLTTLTVVYIAGRELFVAHVGHSRAYLLRGGRLTQVTRDHTVSLAQAQPGRPVMVNGATPARDIHHVLSATLGGPSTQKPTIDVEHFGLEDGDVVLLCTNGLTDAVDDVTIANTLRAHTTPDEQCAALLDLAVQADTQDDVTILTARYHIG